MRRLVCCTAILWLLAGTTRIEAGTCKSWQFECGDGQCTYRKYVCDGGNDCKNGKDEQLCNGTCADYLFKCANGKCVPTNRLCDGHNGCGDNSDEDYCTKIDGCIPNQFRCGDGQCVPKRLCDGFSSGCADGSDALHCKASANAPCPGPPGFLFQCGNGKCIPQVKVCDTNNHCGDNSDEDFCKTSEKCPPSTFQCESGGCITYEGICGYRDCPDGSDDKFCNGSCPDENYFPCLNGHCIPSRWKCDGIPQCTDNSDEFHCPGINNNLTGSNNGSSLGRVSLLILAFMGILSMFSI